MEKKFAGSTHIFYRLIRYLLSNSNVLNYEDGELKNYLQDIDMGDTIQIFTNKSEAHSLFLKDMEDVKNKVIISIPDGNLDQEMQMDIYKRLVDLIAKGIPVLAKSNDYASLPTKWKEIVWGTDNAKMPLTSLDNIIWYGMPVAVGTFKDGEYGYATVCPLYVRFSGKHTVEIIRSLTDLDYREVSSTRSILKPRYQGNNKNTDSGEPAGLAGFIGTHMHCRGCGSLMQMKKNMRGVFYIKCKKCDHMEYLTPEFVDHYISVDRVKCTVDGGEIYAKLGKRGTYIRCTEGHLLGVESI